MNLEYIQRLIKDDLAVINDMIFQKLHSDEPLINQISHYIIQSGGKRIRPMLTLLAARTLSYPGQHHRTAALFIELIHTATLLHDDVVDNSQLRRGKATANNEFGNAASVLVGDFIYTRAFQVMMQINSQPILDLMVETTNQIAEGEVMQLANCHDPDMNEERYLQIVYRKTACLFEAAAYSGALLATDAITHQRALKSYGCHLGIAFQLVDDILDYNAEEALLGKNIGDDLSEGKPTLPLLHALWHGTPEQSAMIRQAIVQGCTRALFDPVLNVMQQCGSLNYVQQRAEEEASKAIAALQALPNTPYREALKSLASLVLHREG